ncbi:hypothetical protein PORCRE_1359 [Porphyromonas crevioricanis JCM 15906]|uniref:Uncharacterized protein n=1 Tax=Porphyromonas crevioricanis JCM 15906 TaxID=1305617 RepID=T1DT78_9PORP|nr:hypothetical protein PORCRE_1359 [Porphyromonas crevioricanis JCM 15906]
MHATIVPFPLSEPRLKSLSLDLIRSREALHCSLNWIKISYNVSEW